MPYLVFDCEDDAAKFIARVKIEDPDDDFTYVISADPLNSEKFFLEIFAPDERYLGRV